MLGVGGLLLGGISSVLVGYCSGSVKASRPRVAPSFDPFVVLLFGEDGSDEEG